MHPKKHAKVETLTQARQKALDELFYLPVGGQAQPRYSPDLQAEKTRAIESKYDADLLALMDAAEKQGTTAEAILARVDRPYEWLDPVEMARAATLAPFVREDFATLDAAGLVQAVQAAAGAGRAEKWLALRYAAMRYAELDRDIQTALGMGAKAHYSPAVQSLRDSVMPATERRERADAQKQLDDAKNLYDAAEWARPSVKQDFAARMGIDARYVD